jgi:putative transposase
VPWSGYDLINAFNTWKKSEDAGRVFVVAGDGTICKQATGLAWRQVVSAQVFEEAAVDLGRTLTAYCSAKSGSGESRPVGFPKYKRKGHGRDSFRLRNKTVFRSLWCRKPMTVDVAATRPGTRRP